MEITRTTNLSRGLTGLSVPVIGQEHIARLDFALPAFTQWCNSLPIADTASAAKMLFLALTELNKTKLDPEHKFSIAEIVRRPLYSTVLGLRKHYANDQHTLAKKKLMIAELAQTLHTEITHTYKTIVEEITQGKGNFDPKYKNTIQVSLYRIIYFSLRRFFRSYQLYNSIEPDLWREAHLVYRIACQLKTEKTAIGTQYTVENFPVTVENCYKQILLLAATNPYQWRQIEQDAIMLALNYWTESTIIRPYNDDLKKCGVYVFSPTKDAGPIAPQLYKDKINANSLVLDLNNLVKELSVYSSNTDTQKDRVTFPGKDNTEYSLSTACFNKLLHDWTKEVKPKDLRVPATGSMRTAFGLSATYNSISKRQNFISKQSKNNLNYLQSEDEEKKNETKTHEEIFPIHVSFLKDQSPGGYQIMHYSDTHPKIHAGDVIGFKMIDRDQKSLWGIGEIRWLTYGSAENLSIGIRKLSNNPLPVAVNIVRIDNTNQDIFLRCILFGDEPKIITPVLPFKQGQEININIDEKTSKKAILIKQLSASGTFKIFEYQEIASTQTPSVEQSQDQIEVQVEAPKAEGFDQQKVVTEFDDIWHTL